MRVSLLPGNANEVADPKAVYKRLCHALIQMRLHLLIRALGLHYSGEGWRIVRTKQEEYFKPGDIGHDLWLSSDTCEWKCLVRMRLKNLDTVSLDRDVPNVLLYKGEP
ncbi:unnamed protein product [Mortierella alpina]